MQQESTSATAFLPFGRPYFAVCGAKVSTLYKIPKLFDKKTLWCEQIFVFLYDN